MVYKKRKRAHHLSNPQNHHILQFRKNNPTVSFQKTIEHFKKTKNWAFSLSSLKTWVKEETKIKGELLDVVIDSSKSFIPKTEEALLSWIEQT